MPPCALPLLCSVDQLLGTKALLLQPAFTTQYALPHSMPCHTVCPGNNWLSTYRLSALEELSGMEVLCSDKTGTLTLNK